MNRGLIVAIVLIIFFSSYVSSYVLNDEYSPSIGQRMSSFFRGSFGSYRDMNSVIKGIEKKYYSNVDSYERTIVEERYHNKFIACNVPNAPTDCKPLSYEELNLDDFNSLELEEKTGEKFLGKVPDKRIWLFERDIYKKIEGRYPPVEGPKFDDLTIIFCNKDSEELFVSDKPNVVFVNTGLPKNSECSRMVDQDLLFFRELVIFLKRSKAFNPSVREIVLDGKNLLK